MSGSSRPPPPPPPPLPPFRPLKRTTIDIKRKGKDIINSSDVAAAFYHPSTSSIEMEDNTQRVLDITSDLENVIIKVDMDKMDECCIYTVPEFIKKGKEECYEPLVISIGPIFYKDPKLKAMEELKHIYLKCFLELPDNASRRLEPYNNFVRNHESKIHKCYQEQKTSIPSEEFINMIVLDAAFLIFLFLSYDPDYRPSNNTELDKIENKLYLLRKFIGRDVLCVEENQLPFFVLEGMYSIAFGDEDNLPVPTLTHIALDYIQYLNFPGREVVKSIIDGRIILQNASSNKHLVHFQRECYCLLFCRRVKESKESSGKRESKTLSGIKHLMHLQRECCCLLFCRRTKESKKSSEKRESKTLSGIKHLLHLQRECCCLPFCRQAKESKKGSEKRDSKTLSGIKHLVHLQRECCCLLICRRAKESKKSSKKHKSKILTAKQLSAAGVKFQIHKSDDPFHITFDKSSGVLKIPKLSLEDHSEAFFRSILFFEQCHIHTDRYFTDYIIFLDELVDTLEDIQILQQNEILHNDLGSDEDAVELFNKLLKNTFYDSSDFAFSDVYKDLNDYASTRWNRWKAIFWQKYFNHPWAVISVIYAIILLILTVVQTLSGFISK